MKSAIWRWVARLFSLPLLGLCAVSLSLAAEPRGSTCYGTPARGRLLNGVALPAEGPNFSAYSSLAKVLGRDHVHDRVRDTVVNAYQALERAAPGKHFVYGETGHARGGPFKPHRTHQNGLSVDFMVPVRDRLGRSVPLPAHAGNRFGYDVEFDSAGRFDDLSIDFDAMAEHLAQLQLAAKRQGIDIERVIFTPSFHSRLWATPRGAELKARLKFMPNEAWVRHDEHYHVDFKVTCLPLR